MRTSNTIGSCLSPEHRHASPACASGSACGFMIFTAFAYFAIAQTAAMTPLHTQQCLHREHPCKIDPGLGEATLPNAHPGQTLTYWFSQVHSVQLCVLHMRTHIDDPATELGWPLVTRQSGRFRHRYPAGTLKIASSPTMT